MTGERNHDATTPLPLEPLRGGKTLSVLHKHRRVEQSRNPDVQAHVEFCRHAERCGIESLLTAFGFHRPDPIVLATALGCQTEAVAFMIAVRSGVFAPTAYVQQVNTLSVVTGGRVLLERRHRAYTGSRQRFTAISCFGPERFERDGRVPDSLPRVVGSDNVVVTFQGKYSSRRRSLG